METSALQQFPLPSALYFKEGEVLATYSLRNHSQRLFGWRERGEKMKEAGASAVSFLKTNSIMNSLSIKSSKGLRYHQSQYKLPKCTNQTLLYGEILGRNKKELKKSNVAGIFIGVAKFRRGCENSQTLQI